MIGACEYTVIAVICMGFKRFHKQHRLKPMQIPAITNSREEENILKPLKTHVPVMVFKQKRAREEQDNFSFSALAMRRHVSHALAQLRLARTHERIEIEIEIDFPVGGSDKPD